MRNVIAVTLTVGALSGPALAVESTPVDSQNKAKMTEDFVKHQVSQSMSIGRAIKSIISHYPEQAEVVVSTALDLYPEKYKEIIHAAISEEPALSDMVVTVALEKGISNCSSIVQTAINAEPSYVDFVVEAAANSTPDELDEIVRIAVVTEPDSADHIVQTLTKSHPSKMTDMIKTAIGAVPFVGEYVVDALLAMFPGKAENVVTTAVRESNAQQEHVKKIIETARNAGISDSDLMIYAMNAGADEQHIQAILDNKD